MHTHLQSKDQRGGYTYLEPDVSADQAPLVEGKGPNLATQKML